MKSPKEWIRDIAESGEDHKPACVCERCKKGREVFLLESDIEKIQADAKRMERDGTDQNQEPYFVEVEANGCAHCGLGREWTVVTPDGAALGQTWPNEEDAVHFCELLNEAYQWGVDGAADKRGGGAQ